MTCTLNLIALKHLFNVLSLIPLPCNGDGSAGVQKLLSSVFFENNTMSNSCSGWNGSTVKYDVTLLLIQYNKVKENTVIKLIWSNPAQFTSLAG